MQALALIGCPMICRWPNIRHIHLLTTMSNKINTLDFKTSSVLNGWYYWPSSKNMGLSWIFAEREQWRQPSVKGIWAAQNVEIRFTSIEIVNLVSLLAYCRFELTLNWLIFSVPAGKAIHLQDRFELLNQELHGQKDTGYKSSITDANLFKAYVVGI